MYPMRCSFSERSLLKNDNSRSNNGFIYPHFYTFIRLNRRLLSFKQKCKIKHDGLTFSFSYLLDNKKLN